MSSILRGLNENVEIAENSSAELIAKLENVESILGTRSDSRSHRQFNQAVQDITKNIKYLSQDNLVMEISSKIRDIAEAIGLPEKELEYAEDDVRKAFNNLEQAVYKLEEPFEDFVRDLQYKVEELEEIDEGQRCWKGYEKKGTKKMFGKTVNNCVKKESVEEVDEGMYDEEAFDAIFKDRKDKDSMEKTKSKPKDTGMYNQPTKRSPKYYDNGPEDSKKKSSMGKVMEMYDDILYLMYIDGKLAMPTPIEKKDMNKYERLLKNVLPGSDIQFKGTPRHYYSSEELAEGNGNIRKALAGIILLGGLLGLNNHQAQKIYDQSHQLQQLTQVYMVAKERGDEAKMKDVKRRIGNHKMRLDLGKGDVDFDGRPGDDDIKDIDYINPIEER